MNIVYMGTPEFALIPLEMLAKSRHNIIAIVTQPDRQQGRGKKMIFSPVKQFAVDKDIPVFQPTGLKDNHEIVTSLRGLDPDIIVVAAYGKILPKDILELPRFGCINIHGSLLPKYRGASPIQAAILNGDEITGISIMQMDEGMDTGDIIAIKELKVAGRNYIELTGELARIGGNLLMDTLDEIEDGNVKRLPQNHEMATYTEIIKKEAGHVNFAENNPKEIGNMLRAFDPWPGVFCYHGEELIKIKDIALPEEGEDDAETRRLMEDSLKKPGSVLKTDDNGIYVKVKDGYIIIRSLQRAGKKTMDAANFLRGYAIKVDDVLG